MSCRDIRIVDVDRARLRETIDAIERAEDIDAAWHAYVLASLGEDADQDDDGGNGVGWVAAIGVSVVFWGALWAWMFWL